LLRKTVSGIMLFLLLVSTLTVAFNIKPVKAEGGTIYIRADGSIDPPTAPISTVDLITYIFRGNIYDEIVIERDNIIVDGAGYTVQGAGAGIGIYLYGRYNVTLRNMKVTKFSYGVRLDYTNSNVLFNVNVTNNDWVGIYLYYSNNNLIFGSAMYYNGYCGVKLENSHNNNVSKNAALYNGEGISLVCSENNTVYSNGASFNEAAGISLYYYSKNNAIHNNGGLFLNKYGIYCEKSINNTILGNEILGEVFPSYGIVLCASSENNTVSDNHMDNCGIGIMLDESNCNVLNRNIIPGSNISSISLTNSHGNLISSNDLGKSGIDLGGDFGSNNNIVTNNTFYGVEGFRGVGISGSNNIVSFNLIQNGFFGISVSLFSSNNTILYNTIYLSLNGFIGIDLIGADHNFISCNTIDGGNYSIMVSGVDNIISNNTVSGGSNGGIYLGMAENITLVDNNVYYCSNGIALSQSFNNTILRNNVLRNLEGIYLTCSSNNTISENKIANNDYGIGLDYSSNNTIYHNNFMDNTHQATISPSGYANCWDNGYPSGGNYWSDYTGADVKHGSSQDLLGSDGIGDTPYDIDAYNQDRYPLMKPWCSVEVVFDVIWEEIVYPVIVVSNSTVTNFNFSQPDKQISFDVAGPDGTIGICNATIPKALLYGEPWTVLIDGAPVPATITENATHTFLYFTYTHSTHTIQVIGTWVITPLPSTYNLTITTTVGGTTDPAPGTYTYTANASVQVTAIPNADYLFDHWELDTINVGSANPYTVLMDNNHTLKAVFAYSPPPPSLTASISPLSASILVGQSVTFTSAVSGGYTPYSYQWYLNGNPVAGATSNTWTFTPTTSGIYYIHLKVTDNVGNVENSNHSNVTVVGPDINGDGKVDMTDIAIAGRAFGAVPGDARWNPLADVNLDGKVDLRDIALTAKMFGKHLP
jgi:parallel beta-helix repeat protein